MSGLWWASRWCSTSTAFDLLPSPSYKLEVRGGRRWRVEVLAVVRVGGRWGVGVGGEGDWLGRRWEGGGGAGEGARRRRRCRVLAAGASSGALGVEWARVVGEAR